MTEVAGKKRGRETALDMIRSLAIVFALVVPLWFLGQASPGDGKRIRPVDPAPALQGFARDTGTAVPSGTPAGWVVNVARAESGGVRIGYVVGEQYTEFVAGRGETFLDDITGKGKEQGGVDVNGVPWRVLISAEGQESLVRTAGAYTLVVGGVRESVARAQLKTLAATVR